MPEDKKEEQREEDSPKEFDPETIQFRLIDQQTFGKQEMSQKNREILGDWRGKVGEIRGLMGHLTLDEVSSIPPKSWHLLLSSYGRLYDVDIIEADELPDDPLEQLGLLKDIIKKHTGKENNISYKMHYDNTVAFLDLSEGRTDLHHDSPEFARETAKRLEDGSIIVPVLSKGIMFALTDYLEASTELKKQGLSPEEASKKLESLFVYASWVNRDEFKRKGGDPALIENEVMLAPPDSFFESVIRGTSEHHSIFVEDQVAQGDTLDAVFGGIPDLIRQHLKRRDLVADPDELSYKFFRHLRLHLSAFEIRVPSIQKLSDPPRTVFEWGYDGSQVNPKVVIEGVFED